MPNLTLLRVLAYLFAGMAGLAVAYFEGIMGKAYHADTSRISLVIVALFLVGVYFTLVETVRLVRAFDHLGQRYGREGEYWLALQFRTPHGVAADVLRRKLFVRIQPIRYLAGSLVFLGLIGTVWGFIIAMEGVDPTKAGDVNYVMQMVSILVDGMGVALYTTLIGSVFSLWLMALYNVLYGATTRLYTKIVEITHG